VRNPSVGVWGSPLGKEPTHPTIEKCLLKYCTYVNVYIYFCKYIFV
jgi:hypothetical protein